jgi:hypothetical protein
MKKIPVLLSFMFVMLSSMYAQNKNLKFSIGPEYSVPTFSGSTSSGVGGGISLEHFFNRKIAVTIEISYNYFKGNIADFYKHDTINGFSIMPVLIGGKYFFTNKFYVSGAAGLIIGWHNAANHLGLSTGAGLLIPVSARSQIDLGVKLTGVPTGYSFPENSFLNKGGYSFITFKAAYVF